MVRPIALTLQAFGPYAGRQKIDFAALDRAGLFLIYGETGSGKTLLLDAMTYALYGDVSSDTQGTLDAVRCQSATKDTPTEILFECESSGQKYRFLRRLWIKGESEPAFEQNIYFENTQKEFEPFFKAPNAAQVREKTIQLIGLNSYQFRQIMILPQGQFERLLSASAEETESLLTTLFHAGQWKEASKRLSGMFRAEGQELEELRQEKAALCQTFGCNQACELPLRKKRLQDRANRIKAEYDIMMQTVAQSSYEIEEATAVDAAFTRLKAAEQTLRQLKTQEEEQQQRRERLRLRALVDPFNRWRKAVRDARLCKENVQFSRLAEASCIQERKMLDAEERQAQDQHALLQQKAQHKPRLEAELKRFEQRRSLQKEVDSIRGQLFQKQADRTRCDQRYRSCLEQSSRAAVLHLQQLSCELAGALQEGMPCPVCGNTHHPSPVQAVDGEITRERLQQLNERLRQAEIALTRSTMACEGLEEQLRLAVERLEKAGGYDPEAHTLVQNQGKAATAAVHKLEMLEKRLSEFSQRRSELELKEKTIKISLYNGETRLARMEAAEESLRHELDRLDPDGSARARLYEEKPTPALFAKLEQELQSYDEQLFASYETVRMERERLAGKTKPELARLQIEIERLQSRSQQLHSALEATQEQLKCIDDAEERILSIQERLDTRSDACERLASFARLIDGDQGISLQHYALGVMLSAVISEANRLLGRMHGGRYQLCRKAEIRNGTYRAGLDLEILDRQSGEKQSAATLSGSEKFFAALSLSLGLSTITRMQAGGEAPGAIFIDEGFETLDEQSLQDAVNTLFEILPAHGMIGIISHIGLLRKSIESGIEVIKTPEGSKLKML